MSGLLQDVRYGIRMLAKRPFFTALIVVSLALGIGGNTAIFSAVNAVMLKMLPVRDPQQLKMVAWTVPTSDFPDTYVEDLEGSFTRVEGGRFGSYSISYPAYEEIAARNLSFDSTFAMAANDQEVNVAIEGHAEGGRLVAISGNFFSGFGATPAAGRALQPSDDAIGATPVVMISYRMWQDDFGRSSGAIGSTITVNGQPMTIIGVAPKGFFGVESSVVPDLWVSLHWYAAQLAQLNSETNPEVYLHNKRAWWVAAMGRLKPGVTEAAANTELSVLLQHSLERVSHSGGTTESQFGGDGAAPEEHASAAKDVTPQLALMPLARGLDTLRREISKPLWLLMGMVAFVLLITCANVAALLLTRAASREKEVAVRVSLGAHRSRIIRQIFTESLLLALMGGVAGVLVARWASTLIRSLMSTARNPISIPFEPDLRVLSFTLAIVLLSAVFFSVAPAWHAARVQPLTSLKKTANASVRTGFLSGKLLVAVQIALSLVLVFACGLFVRTLQHLKNVDIGFERANLTRFMVSPGFNGYSNQQLDAYYQNLRAQLRQVPGIQSVAFAMRGPIGQGSAITTGEIAGYTAAGKTIDIYRHDVGPSYFETLGIPILLGRGITGSDGASAPKVAVINEALARKYFHGDNPLGHRINLGSKTKPVEYEIVGVSRDVKYAKIRDDVPPTAYFSYIQRKEQLPFMTYEVRSTLPQSTLQTTIERAALALDPTVPVSNIRTEEEVVDQVVYLERTFAMLSSGFGGLALLLAAIGLYGTIAYTVAQRTNEIGIRMALGADRERIVRMVLREIGVLVVAGLAVGLPAAWLGSQTLRSQLFGLSPHDGFSLTIAVGVILAVCAIAGSIPATRAARVEPMEALRYE